MTEAREPMTAEILMGAGRVSRPRLLDLFCGAGGAAMGYHRAGFDVVGVDINPQPHYPFEFHQRDALEVLDEVRVGLITRFDAIHASPPCQSYSVLAHYTKKDYPRLVEPVRELLAGSGLPWVIENVVGAPLINPVRLCGSSFGLGVRRHRLFEMSDPPALVPSCSHFYHPNPVDVTGSGRNRIVSRPGHREAKPHNIEHARQVMGIDWMTRSELSEAIPPAYTRWIGEQLMRVLRPDDGDLLGGSEPEHTPYIFASLGPGTGSDLNMNALADNVSYGCSARSESAVTASYSLLSSKGPDAAA